MCTLGMGHRPRWVTALPTELAMALKAVRGLADDADELHVRRRCSRCAQKLIATVGVGSRIFGGRQVVLRSSVCSVALPAKVEAALGWWRS